MSNPANYGMTTPTGSDLIRDGDDAITNNAQRAAALLGEALAVARSGPIYDRGHLSTGTNLDTLRAPAHNGIYSLRTANTYTNNPLPDGVAGKLLVEANQVGVVRQYVQEYGDGRTWTRHLTNAYSNPVQWSPWTLGDGLTKGTLTNGRNIDGMLWTADAGLWRVSWSNTYPGTWPVPTPNGELLVLANGNGSAKQVFYPYQSNDTWERAVTDYTAAAWTPWRRGLTAADVTGAVLAASIDPDRATAPAASLTTQITVWGDSLTQAGGLTARLAELRPGVTVTNRGVSGQLASQIAARQGGRPSLLTLAGDTIPATGPVAVTHRTAALLAATGSPARTETGTLAGIPGTLANPAGSTAYTFTRATAGDPVPVPPDTPFIPDNGRAARPHTQVIWAGRNNPEEGYVDPVLSMVHHLTPATPHFLVVSVTNNPSETTGTARHSTITSQNARLAAALGDRFLDLRRWLIDNGLDALGITPTAADLSAIAGDAVPPSLTTDGVHFTSSAQRLIGERIHARLLALEEQTAQDTGWRRLTPLENVAGNIFMRRKGADVHMMIQNVATTVAGHTNIATIPAGFVPQSFTGVNWRNGIVSDDAGTSLRLASFFAGRMRILNAQTAKQYGGYLTWITSDPWPTTFPGAPA